MLTIVVPLGGQGKAFAERGYTFPKPLIEINGRPMIELVVRCITPREPHRFVFICQAEHLERYALGDVLSLIAPGCRIVKMAESTGGALCSILLAIEHIDLEDELIIANGDQYIEVPIDSLIHQARQGQADGCLMTFPSTHPKWSYVKLNEAGEVVGVAEKHPISKHATVGLYYFRRGQEFLEAAERMIVKGSRTSGEFYVAPVYNELILEGKRMTILPISREKMHGLGTPEDVEEFSKLALAKVEGA